MVSYQEYGHVYVSLLNTSVHVLFNGSFSVRCM